MFVADRFSSIAATVPPLLNTVSAFHSVLGPSVLSTVSNLLNRVTGSFMPTWNPYMPKGAAPLQPAPPAPVQRVTPLEREIPRKVVYMPSCVTRMMGPAYGDEETDPVHAKLMSILGKVRCPSWSLGSSIFLPLLALALAPGLMHWVYSSYPWDQYEV